MLELLLLIALAILIAVIWKPVSKIVFGALDGHAAKVRAELDEAKRLREQAQTMLAEHQRKLEGGEDHAKTIVEHAREEAERQSERHRAELAATLERRTQQAVDRIAQAETRALSEVRAHAATLVVRTTERLLREQLNEQHAQTLLEGAIEEVGKKLA
jgi:F-type H+-transporting ATPase subunit b